MGYRVIAPDARGHGGTGAATSYTAEAMARDVLSLIIELDLYRRPLCLVGAGMGAAVGVHIRAHKPSLLGLLIAVDPFLELRPPCLLCAPFFGDLPGPAGGAAEDDAMAWYTAEWAGGLSRPRHGIVAQVDSLTQGPCLGTRGSMCQMDR